VLHASSALGGARPRPGDGDRSLTGAGPEFRHICDVEIEKEICMGTDFTIRAQ